MPRNQYSSRPHTHNYILRSYVSPETFDQVRRHAKLMKLPLEEAVMVLIRRGLKASPLNQENEALSSNTPLDPSLS